jgi:hypothetical protein
MLRHARFHVSVGSELRLPSALALTACVLLAFGAAQATAFSYQGYLLSVRADLQQRMEARFGSKAVFA